MTRPIYRKIASFFTLLTLCPGLFFSQQSHAVYDHAVTWADMSIMDLGTALKSQYASSENLFYPIISKSVFELALKDADNRIGQEFKIPNELRPSVEFWLKIYTTYTSEHVVIFDKRNPEYIYEVLDFRDFSKTARNRIVYEITTENKINRTLKKYRTALLALSKNPSPKTPTPEQTKILQAVNHSKDRSLFAELSKNVRSQTGQRDSIIKGLLAAESYFPKMEQIFMQEGVPIEITRLCLVESSFNLIATSKVGASGVWQFMERSAHEYMLVDRMRHIDERLSPLKSTAAAAKLLSRNKKILGSWPLAITSYNHGLRGLLKAKNKSHTFSEIAHLFAPKNSKSPLGFASKNYYAEFLAILHAEAYHHLFYGVPPVQPVKNISFRRSKGNKNAITIAMEAGISLQNFRFLNPDILNLQKPLPHGIWLALPENKDNFAGITKNKDRSS